MSDYFDFRGKCKELAEQACQADPTLRLVRGHYFCPTWGKQAHWWAVAPDGRIVDPSARQFPSLGMGDYEPFGGLHECEQCGRQVTEDEAYIDPPHLFCSYECYGRCVMG